MKDNRFESLLADGFAERMAHEYLDTMEEELASGLFDEKYMRWAHSEGFYAISAYSYNLTPETVNDYVSDYDFCRMWPLNGWQRIWINDKLTLKYMLAKTPCDKYMPKYYYYSEPTRLVPGPDCTEDATADGFVRTLQAVGEFACKPCNGAMAVGFHKLAYADGAFTIDAQPASADDIKDFALTHPNYVFTEFLYPAPELAKIDPLIHTIRAIVINPDGVSPHLIADYLRFSVGADKSGSTPNYQIPSKADICSLNAYIDLTTGHFGEAKLVYPAHVESCPLHPDSGAPVEGTIACWPDVLKMINDIALALGPVEYLGFDIGITPDGPKIMEINSHSGVQYLQLFRPLLKDPLTADYYGKKLAAINALSKEQKAARNGIRR
ncbi:MAG: sugar-transfer associated ATP-grasp domain-containing protein [Atopobiaceae bacterium]|jgi:hypothetical protein